MGDLAGQAYALTVLTPVRAGEEAALCAYLDGLPTGRDSPLEALGTTHFARWLVLPDLVHQRGQPLRRRDDLGGTYLLFTSNLDGSPEEYVHALCTKISDVADATWGRCVGCPGSAEPARLTAYLMRNRIPTTFFFAAYPNARVADVRRALRLRDEVGAFTLRTRGLSVQELHRAFLAELGGAEGAGS